MMRAAKNRRRCDTPRSQKERLRRGVRKTQIDVAVTFECVWAGKLAANGAFIRLKWPSTEETAKELINKE